MGEMAERLETKCVEHLQDNTKLVNTKKILYSK